MEKKWKGNGIMGKGVVGLSKKKKEGFLLFYCLLYIYITKLFKRIEGC